MQIVRLDLCFVPECIEVLLQEVGNFEGSLSNDSMVYVLLATFSVNGQHDDLRPAESIVFTEESR